MLSFKQFLQQFLQQALNENALTPVEVVLGRFQPFHKGHQFIINSMHNPVIVIIKGAKSSLDKNKNPLSFEQQAALIKTVYPNIPVIESVSAYIPAIVQLLREKGMEPTKIYAGADRIADYTRMVDVHNKKVLAGEYVDSPEALKEPINVMFEEMPRITSATQVRDAIRTNDFETYKILMPDQLATKQIFNDLRAVM